MGKQVFEEMFKTGKKPAQIVEEKDLKTKRQRGQNFGACAEDHCGKSKPVADFKER